MATRRVRLVALALLTTIVAAGTASARDFLVSPQGTPGGDGSKARPWDLGTALNHPEAVKPGDTIWLLGGVYRGAFKSRLKGAAGAPITVRQVPGGRATIDCRSDDSKQRVDFVVEGEHARYWGFEIMSSDPDRWSDAKGSHPPEGNRGRPTGVKVIVRPNRYEAGRANVIVYNWDQTPEVQLDLRNILKRGQTYRIVSAQDFFGKPVAEGTFDGRPVRLPMRDYRAPPPVGKPDYVPPATGPEFNVFVVLPAE